MNRQLPLIAGLLMVGAFAAWRILQLPPPAADDDHSHEAAAAATAHEDDHDHSEGHPHDTPAANFIPAEGPRGGKLLHGDGFEVEVTIFEDGVPPEFRLYAYRQGQPLPPTELKARLHLERLDRQDEFVFQPRGEYLRGDGVVSEPHSFAVTVHAEHAGRKSTWTYESFEGRTTLAPDLARAAGVQVAQAGPATIRETVTLHGLITVDANRVARVGARFPGLVKAVHKSIGDPVAAGEVLAVVESNESLQSYELRSPQAGLVTERAASVSAVTGDAPLFVVTDLSTVWVELKVFPADARRVTAGLPATVRSPDGTRAAEIVLGPYLPTASPEGQARIVRVALDNRDGGWTPGLRVLATVQLSPHEAALAVRTAGLQSFRDFTVVFAQVGDTYEVRMLELGRSDGDFSEVLGGLAPGERYVTANSFLLKADVLKSGASHDH